MSCVVVDLQGKIFDRLTVVGQAGRDDYGQVFWKCQCSCGNEITVRSSGLRKRLHRSCGCLRKEVTRSRSLTHGGSGSSEYNSYRAMLRRCYDPNHRAYPWYGAKGIKVCQQWQDDFKVFLNDMGPRPEGWTLDRKENHRDYGPDNCRWASWSVQARNKRQHLPSLPRLET